MKKPARRKLELDRTAIRVLTHPPTLTRAVGGGSEHCVPSCGGCPCDNVAQ